MLRDGVLLDLLPSALCKLGGNFNENEQFETTIRLSELQSEALSGATSVRNALERLDAASATLLSQLDKSTAKCVELDATPFDTDVTPFDLDSTLFDLDESQLDLDGTQFFSTPRSTSEVELEHEMPDHGLELTDHGLELTDHGLDLTDHGTLENGIPESEACTRSNFVLLVPQCG